MPSSSCRIVLYSRSHAPAGSSVPGVRNFAAAATIATSAFPRARPHFCLQFLTLPQNASSAASFFRPLRPQKTPVLMRKLKLFSVVFYFSEGSRLQSEEEAHAARWFAPLSFPAPVASDQVKVNHSLPPPFPSLNHKIRCLGHRCPVRTCSARSPVDLPTRRSTTLRTSRCWQRSRHAAAHYASTSTLHSCSSCRSASAAAGQRAAGLLKLFLRAAPAAQRLMRRAAYLRCRQ